MNSRGIDGRTPLHHVADNGRLKLFEYCSRAMRDDGFTPLFGVSRSGNTTGLLLLLGHNADEHVRDKKGTTPLHHAAGNDDLEAARILLERNAKSMSVMTMGSPFLRASETEVGASMFCGYCSTTTQMSLSVTTLEPPHCISQRSAVTPILLVYYLNAVQRSARRIALNSHFQVHHTSVIRRQCWTTIPMSTLTTGE